ncbi:MAG: EAL domain-containing protein [Cellulomonadaceae bacterium]|nr:EAL domain-containing protein [Cellulomonadaceae bacterium]
MSAGQRDARTPGRRGGPDPRRTGVPQRLQTLDPLAMIALAAHARAVTAVAPESARAPVLAVAALLVVLGAVGMAGWRGTTAVAVRAGAVLATAYVLMALHQPASGYFLLWYFVVVAIYPLVLPQRTGRVVALAAPGIYLLLLPLGAADGPLPVAALRAVSLGLIGLFVNGAATAYRDAEVDRDSAIAQLDTYAEAAPVGLAVWDPSLRFLRLNASFAELTGLPVEAQLGRVLVDLPQVESHLALTLVRVLTSGEPVEDVELVSGTRVWTSSFFPVRVGDRVMGVGGVALEVTEQRAVERALSFSATHDALTGLPNRALFGDRLGVALAQAAPRGAQVAVLFCDIDRFKMVNHSIGHAAGDDLLRVVAERLAAVLDPGETVARLGGDEFGLVCTAVTDLAGALAVADRVCAAMRVPIQLGDRPVTATVSVGVALCEAGEADVVGALRDADVAMYQAKDAGRDQVAVFDVSMRSRAGDRLEFHGALRAAIERDEIEVAYQPVMHLDSRGAPELVGFEALARWHRPEGDVPPPVFIATAEDLGLIHVLGERVLRAACTTVQQWRQETARDLTIAVNLSAAQLADGRFADVVAGVLADVGLPASALQLEITESILMTDVDQSQRRLAELRGLGVGLAIDDFGTGYSSLAYLRDLPVDLLKIDRSFTQRLPEDSPMFAFVVDLARAIGARTVVEGVETAEQLAEVTTAGCDMAQGFFLSRPLTPAAATRLLRGVPAASD